MDELKQLKNFKFLLKDVRSIDHHDLPQNPDIVFHLASRASPEDYRLNPIDTLESNSIGTKNLLEYSLKNESLFFFTSTSEIYGNTSVIPTPESYYGCVNTMGERSCYDEGKRFSESLIYAYQQTYNIDTRIVRIFNTYGPRLRPDGNYGRGLPRFILQCLQNKPITVYGDGLQTRSFNYITDTITGFMAVLTSKSFKGKPVNVGNKKEITILELIETTKKITKSNSDLKFLPPASDDPRRRSPDTTKLEQLGWKPKVQLEEGLEKTMDWIKNNYV